jgi:hypothetical protein
MRRISVVIAKMGVMPEPASPGAACFCLCLTYHQTKRDVCTGIGDVRIALETPRHGTVNVRVCRPCAALLTPTEPDWTPTLF